MAKTSKNETVLIECAKLNSLLFIQLAILETVESVVKIKSSGKLLERSFSLLPFLRDIAGSSDASNSTCLAILLRIINKSIDLTSHPQYLLFETLIKLRDTLNQNVGIETYNDFLNALLLVLNLDKSLRKHMSKEFVNFLIDESEKYLGNVNYLRYSLEHVFHSIDSEHFNSDSSDVFQLTHNNLRKLIAICHLSKKN